jgi:hypothetical protein
MGRLSYFLGLSCLLAATTSLFACGGSQPAPAAPADSAATPPAEAPAAAPAADAPGSTEGGWSDSMSTKDKAAFMKAKVMPAMSKVFQDYDAKEYAGFSCKTCHGKDMKPKPVMALPELNMKAGKMVEAEKKPELAKFMHEKVVPAMAELFGKPTFDPKTMQGFGCMGCHKVNM